MSKINDIATFVKLHEKSLLSEEAVLKGIENIIRPQPAKPTTGGQKWVAPKTTTLEAHYFDFGNGISGVASSDIYSGSILKPDFQEYHDCKQSPCPHIKPKRGTLKNIEKNKPSTLEIVTYEDTVPNHLPEHARMVIQWINEEVAKQIEQYEETKDDWVRLVDVDEDGKEHIRWVEKSEVDAVVDEFNKFFAEVESNYADELNKREVVVEGDDAAINGLQHIFNLHVSGVKE